MKSLNRTLSLVLVLVMVLGMFGIASAAKIDDFSDKDQITYTEAVDYLTAAGVVAGDTATTINPKGTFTREQAAKLVAYACLGQTAADNFKASSAPFTDVSADRWSAGYIAYCTGVGIINGMGDGTFAPAANVTGYQLAKMLLSAVGYGKNNEFVGASWNIEVAKLALSKDLFKGNVAGASNNPVNREEAFLYTFNTLSNINMVNYNKQLDAYFDGLNPFDTTGLNTRTIGADRFGMIRTVDTDPMGRPAHFWSKNNVRVTATYPNEEVKVLGKITDGTRISAATTNTNSKYIARIATTGVDYFYNGAAVPVKINGATTVAGEVYAKDDLLYVAAGATAAAGDLEYSIKGAIVTLYAGTAANANRVDKISVIEKTVAVLASAPTTKTTGSVTTVTIPGIMGITDINVTNVVYPNDLKKDDVVLYYRAGAKYYVEKATAVTDTLTSFVASGAGATPVSRVTLGSTNYAISQLTGGNAATGILNTTVAAGFLGKAGFTYYLDNGDNVCYYEAPGAVAILSRTVFLSARASSAGLDGTVAAVVVGIDGASKEVKVSTVGGAAATPVNVVANDFYSYTLLADGSYALTSLSANSTTYTTTLASSPAVTLGDTSHTITPKKAQFLTQVTATAANWDSPTLAPQLTLANSNTVFMYYDNLTKTYTVKTGISNALAYAAGGDIYVLDDGAGVATLVVAKNSSTTLSPSAYDQVFVTSLANVSADANGTPTYTYMAIVNGEKKPVVSYAAMSHGELYFVRAYASNGNIQTVSQGIVGTTVPDATAVSYSNGTMTITGTGGASYVLNSNAKVYFCDARDLTNITSAQITAEYAALLPYSGNDIVTVIPASTTDPSIVAVYVTIN